MMHDLASKIVENSKKLGLKVVTAESCTGGLVSSAITSIPGSSEIYDCGFITYSYESKTDILRVDPNLIQECGAVSKEVAIEMALGAMRLSNADISVALTGIAGPSGATETKPIGLVHFATLYEGELVTSDKIFKGNRDEIRDQASVYALQMILDIIKKAYPAKDSNKISVA